MNDIAKAGLKYFLIFLLLYGVLTGLSLIPGVAAAANTVYRKTTTSLLSTIFPEAYIKLQADPTDADVIDVIYVSKREMRERMNDQPLGGRMKFSGQSYRVRFYNMFLSFYLFFVALMILSPLSWKERLIGIGIGSVIFYLFTVFKISLSLYHFFNLPENNIYHASESYLSFIRWLNNGITLGVKVIFVVILWAALAFRHNNWKELLERFNKG